jgi:SAM-dependent methyltransferase
MGIKLPRKKERNYLLTAIYRLQKLLPFSNRFKFKIFLDLEWIFDRLSHEYSFRNYSESSHPLRVHTKNFILKHISTNHTVLDLGCKYGEITNEIAHKAHQVVGIDFDADAIKKANLTYQRSNLSFEYGEALTYLNKSQLSFDVLILSHILEHLDDPDQFLKSHVAHFKYVYIELPDFDKSLLNHYRRDMKNNLIYSDPDHISEFDREELFTLIESNGLEVVEAIHIFGVHKFWCKTKING